MSKYEITVWYGIDTFEVLNIQAWDVEYAMATALKQCEQKATRITAKKL